MDISGFGVAGGAAPPLAGVGTTVTGRQLGCATRAAGQELLTHLNRELAVVARSHHVIGGTRARRGPGPPETCPARGPTVPAGGSRSTFTRSRTQRLPSLPHPDRRSARCPGHRKFRSTCGGCGPGRTGGAPARSRGKPAMKPASTPMIVLAKPVGLSPGRELGTGKCPSRPLALAASGR